MTFSYDIGFVTKSCHLDIYNYFKNVYLPILQDRALFIMNQKIKAVIVDDELKSTAVLNVKISKYLPGVEVVGTATNINSAYTLITEHNPEIVFLDITMPGESGFDLLEKYDKVPFETIFVTGHSEYALDALKVSAADYLLKPVIPEELKNAYHKVKNKIDKAIRTNQYELLKFNLNNIGDQNSKVVIPGTGVFDFVYVKDIIRCEGDQKYTNIYLSGRKKIVSSYNIGSYKELLSNYSFFMTHKSHLINTYHIKSYLVEGSVVMSDDSQAPVSRRRKDIFIEKILKGNKIQFLNYS